VGNGPGEAEQRLREEYEERVRLLAGVAEELLAQGCSVEQTARHVHGLRRTLAEEFKALTPEPWRSRIRARTVAVYGNETGPTIEFLRQRGRSWDEIVRGAGRPGSQSW
jgi:hypothetical protein